MCLTNERKLALRICTCVCVYDKREETWSTCLPNQLVCVTNRKKHVGHVCSLFSMVPVTMSNEEKHAVGLRVHLYDWRRTSD